jgi:hypothetical protein
VPRVKECFPSRYTLSFRSTGITLYLKCLNIVTPKPLVYMGHATTLQLSS